MRVGLIILLTLSAVLAASVADAQLGERWRERRAQRQAEGSANPAFPAKGDLASARSESLTHDGLERRYLIQRPAGPGPFPVVILLHGGTQSAARVWEQTSLPTLARQHQFIIVAPDGVDGFWNDGRVNSASGQISTADDVGFLRRVVDDVVTRHGGDRSSVFMTGGSAGGYMTMRYACDAGETLRAAGTVIALMQSSLAARCRPPRPLPWIMVYGTEDPIMPVAGQAEGVIVRRRPQPGMISADATFDFWAGNAGCARRGRTERLPDLDRRDGSTAAVETRRGCAGGTTSSRYILNGAGHVWPASSAGRLAMILGRPNQDIDGGTILWAHFAQTLPR
jgi:polyhydroxybutyrate depolymerase